MTLFAGSLLRTIEFVMVTTDASFPGPQELGRGADDARKPGARGWAGTEQASEPREGTGGQPGRRGPRGARGGHCAELRWESVTLLLVGLAALLSFLTSACGGSGLAERCPDTNFLFLVPFAISPSHKDIPSSRSWFEE